MAVETVSLMPAHGCGHGHPGRASACVRRGRAACTEPRGAQLNFSCPEPPHGASQVVPMVKSLPANAGDKRDAGSIPGSGRFPGGGMATHFSILVWRIPWTEEPGGPWSIVSQRVGHNRVT